VANVLQNKTVPTPGASSATQGAGEKAHIEAEDIDMACSTTI
jgi:hypothetical protein